MLPKLIRAVYRQDYRMWLEFADGVCGEIDLEKELWGEMFDSLRDRLLFAELRLDAELGTVVWPGRADFAPEFLYQQLRPEYQLQPESAAA